MYVAGRIVCLNDGILSKNLEGEGLREREETMAMLRFLAWTIKWIDLLKLILRSAK